MLIWIVDDDIKFVSELKEELAQKLPPAYRKKIENKVFYLTESYQKELTKIQKAKENVPEILFLNPWMENQDLWQHSQKLMQSNLIKNLVIITSVPYGVIEKLSSNQKFYFIQKRHLENDLEKVINQIFAQERNLKKKSEFFSTNNFKKKKAHQRSVELIKSLEDIYYDDTDKDEIVRIFQELINLLSMIEVPQNKHLDKLEKMLAKESRIGQLKMKRLTKDLLDWFKEIGLIDEKTN